MDAVFVACSSLGFIYRESREKGGRGTGENTSARRVGEICGRDDRVCEEVSLYVGELLNFEIKKLDNKNFVRQNDLSLSLSLSQD